MSEEQQPQVLIKWKGREDEDGLPVKMTQQEATYADLESACQKQFGLDLKSFDCTLNGQNVKPGQDALSLSETSNVMILTEKNTASLLETLLKDENLVAAAKAIHECDFLLVSTGAGYSADSGLATYPDIADIEPYRKRNLDYMALCQPHWLKQDPGIFFGFWGDCTNVYRETKPHAGYDIIKSWRDSIVKKNRFKEDFAKCLKRSIDEEAPSGDVQHNVTTEPFFSLTSNVDAHWWNPNTGALFDPCEVTEIHGSVELWQCAQMGCQQKPFPLDPKYRFSVDKNTMFCDQATFLKCPSCNKLARPCILMFGDWGWDDPDDEFKYRCWYDAVKKLRNEHVKNRPKVCAVEIGAGQRVPSIRMMTSRFVEATRGVCVRINPDDGCLRGGSQFKQSTYLPLKGKGLATLEKLDTLIKHFQAQSVNITAEEEEEVEAKES